MFEHTFGYKVTLWIFERVFLILKITKNNPLHDNIEFFEFLQFKNLKDSTKFNLMITLITHS